MKSGTAWLLNQFSTFIMPNDEDTFTGKVYLVKIKRTPDFNSEDYLWTISNVGGDNVDLEDFKSIVEGLNGMGLRTPILSDKLVTWKYLKNSAVLKSVGVVGRPTLLFEEITTFKQVLELAYKETILTNAKGREVLDIKNEQARGLVAGSSGSPPRSQTLQDVINRPSRSQVLDETMRQTKEALAANFEEHGDGSSSSPATAMTFPPPVSSCNQRDPALNVQEQEFVDEFDSTHLDKQQECTDGIFDPAQFSIDAFDNELALLESTPDVDGKQLNRYKSLTKTLRNSLAAACLTVGKLMKIIDARDLQLRDSSSYSAADVLAGLNPTTTKVDKAAVTCLAVDEKFSN